MVNGCLSRLVPNVPVVDRELSVVSPDCLTGHEHQLPRAWKGKARKENGWLDGCIQHYEELISLQLSLDAYSVWNHPLVAVFVPDPLSVVVYLDTKEMIHFIVSVKIKVALVFNILVFVFLCWQFGVFITESGGWTQECSAHRTPHIKLRAHFIILRILLETTNKRLFRRELFFVNGMQVEASVNTGEHQDQREWMTADLQKQSHHNQVKKKTAAAFGFSLGTKEIKIQNNIALMKMEGSRSKSMLIERRVGNNLITSITLWLNITDSTSYIKIWV